MLLNQGFLAKVTLIYYSHSIAIKMDKDWYSARIALFYLLF